MMTADSPEKFTRCRVRESRTGKYHPACRPNLGGAPGS